MHLPALGLGTYLGPADDATDAAYREAFQVFHAGGGRAFDTAANYRGGRSERILGRFFSDLPRASYFISTKAGYLPMGDGTPGESPQAWFERVLRAPGILAFEEVVDGCHSLAPRYLAHQLDLSRQALNTTTLDCFHLHNPEHARPALGAKAFHTLMAQAFEACERFVAEGKIKAYGCATWQGFRVPPEHPAHLELGELLRLAETVAGSQHHFRWIQAPLNLAMTEALNLPTQALQGERVPLLDVAQSAGLSVQISASLHQGRLLGHLPPEVHTALGTQQDALASLQFVRTCPGVTTVLCGMSRAAHVRENLRVLQLPPGPHQP